MGLEADLSVKLDASSLVTALLQEIGGPAADLSAVAVPLDEGALSDIASIDADTSGIGAVVSRVVEQAGPLLDELPVAGDVLQPITATLELVESLTVEDLPTQLSDLVASLGAELEGNRQGGGVAALLRISEILSSAPAGQVLLSLITQLTASSGVNLQGTVGGLGKLLPAISAAAHSLGGLMALESVLSESQRLTGIMAGQLDPVRVRLDVEALEACLAAPGTGLLARMEAAGPADRDEIEGIISTLEECVGRLKQMDESISLALGFGEGTLAYLDPQQVQAEVTAAAGLLNSTDLSPLKSLIESAVAGFQPFLNLDLSSAPAQELGDLVGQLEGQVGQFAAQIDALDPAVFTDPLADGIGAVTGVFDALDDAIAQVTLAIQAAMDQVKGVLDALPFDDIADAVQTILEPITEALDQISALVGDISAALESAAGAATTAIEGVESGVDGFTTEVEALFGEASSFIDGLNLDAVVGEVAGKIQEFADLVASADLQPYFDAAQDAIGGTADVVGAVPFAIMPEDVKSEFDTVAQPVRDTDAAAIAIDIEGTLGIGPDGTFELRGDLEAAISQVQERYDQLIATLEGLDPRQHLQTLDDELSAIATQIENIAPDLALQPIQDAIDQVKGAIASFDLEATLAPVGEVFDQITAKLDEYSPAVLIEPLNQRVTAARDEVISALRLAEWNPALDEIEAQALGLLDQLDPVQLEPRIESGLTQIQSLLEVAPSSGGGSWAGGLIAGLLTGSGTRAYPWSFPVVVGWLGGEDAEAHLQERTRAIADSVASTDAAIAELDLTALAAGLSQKVASLRTASAGLEASLGAGSETALRLNAGVSGLDVDASFARLTANAARYREALGAVAPLGETLRNTGLSEVRVTLDALRDTVQPLTAVTGLAGQILGGLGMGGLDRGLNGILGELFAAAPPARFTALVMPLFTALRGRVQAILTAVLAPVRDGVSSLEGTLQAIDLAPLIEAVDGVHQEVMAQIELVNPLVLLAEPIDAFAGLQQELDAFDPLAPVMTVLDALRDAAARILEKLSAERLLESPISIYEEILGILAQLDLQALLSPVLDQLDGIAAQIDVGLDGTVVAFERLQDAIPAPGGGASVSGSVEVGI